MLSLPSTSPGALLRELYTKETLILPGAYDAFTARLAYKAGAKAAYLSGGAISNALLGAPDIALTTLTEVSQVAARCAQAAPIPLICDADTGFGDVWNVTRTVLEFQRAGLAGIHLEDQIIPKKCGHLDGKQLVTKEEMGKKVRAACESRTDPHFHIIARTDARDIEGMEGAISRAKHYVEAGADMIFPEGLTSESEFETFRSEIDIPLLANMTEFGKTPLISAARFAEIGYDVVIFPVTALRTAAKAVQDLYQTLLTEGTQANVMDKMITRKELYTIIDYQRYEDRDKELDRS